MAVRNYYENGKKVYEVYVNGFDSRGVRVQRKRKGIGSLPKAEKIEFELMRELAMLKEARIPYRWSEWIKECLKGMKLVHRPSTVIGYETQLGKWINPRWSSLEVHAITKMQVYKTLFEDVDASLSPWTRKTLLKMVRRIFEMAVEEGIIDRNPCAGIQVKVPEVEQKVLTNTEVMVFLREAKTLNHRFYPVWALALMTGMRSGELFALRWADLDLEARTISVSKQWSSKNGIGPTKTQRSRVVPISIELAKFLSDLRLRRGAESECVLPHLPEWENGEPGLVKAHPNFVREWKASTEETEFRYILNHKDDKSREIYLTVQFYEVPT
jgi:integrase